MNNENNQIPSSNDNNIPREALSQSKQYENLKYVGTNLGTDSVNNLGYTNSNVTEEKCCDLNALSDDQKNFDTGNGDVKPLNSSSYYKEKKKIPIKNIIVIFGVSIVTIVAILLGTLLIKHNSNNDENNGSTNNDSANVIKNNENITDLEEYKIPNWDYKKKIKRIFSNEITTYIITTDNQVYYNNFHKWLKDDNLTKIGDKIKYMDSLYLLDQENIYSFSNPGRDEVQKITLDGDYKIKKMGRGLDQFAIYTIDYDNQFRLFRRQIMTGNYISSSIPDEIKVTGVRDILENYYVTNDNELRGFPAILTDNISSNTTKIGDVYTSLFITKEVKNIYDSGETERIFIIHNDNKLSYYEPNTSELYVTTINDSIGEIKKVIGDGNYSNFIVLSENGNYYKVNSNGLVMHEQLNKIKNQIVNITFYDDKVLAILNNGSVYKVLN
jgi:hypothetical protein